eukprot:TRINITY_DN37909_c0_g1_i1.p1 TRINITY_DN37909_c0_g1~~TRINITY_DN37909_c0_g1_i1.p1  ORF type:complete len:506 (+),score=96.65 TRINITY_DN37909_c0_g1_i1:273-1790(+)
MQTRGSTDASASRRPPHSRSPQRSRSTGMAPALTAVRYTVPAQDHLNRFDQAQMPSRLMERRAQTQAQVQEQQQMPPPQQVVRQLVVNPAPAVPDAVMTQIADALALLSTHVASAKAAPVPKPLKFKDLPADLQKACKLAKDDLYSMAQRLSKARVNDQELKINIEKKTYHPVARKLLHRSWQATKLEIANASVFNVKVEYENLCKKHADETQAFIQKANDLTIATYEPLIKRPAFKSRLDADALKFFEKFKDAYSDSQIEAFKLAIAAWCDEAYSHTISTVDKELLKLQEKKRKHREYTAKLQAEFEGKSTEELLLTAHLHAGKLAKDVQQKQENESSVKMESLGNVDKHKVIVDHATPLGVLLKRQPELAKRYNIGLGTEDNDTRSAQSSQHNTSSRRRSSQRGTSSARSSSVRSSQRGRSSQRSSQRSSSQRSSRRPSRNSQKSQSSRSRASSQGVAKNKKKIKDKRKKNRRPTPKKQAAPRRTPTKSPSRSNRKDRKPVFQ